MIGIPSFIFWPITKCLALTNERRKEIMPKQTTLAQAIALTEQKSHYDASCKRLLAQKIILAFILKACIPAYKDIDIEEIAQKYIEGTPQISNIPVFPDQEGSMIKGESTEDPSLYEGTIFHDIRFRAYIPGFKDPVPILINIEVQNDFWPGYSLIKRGIYYGARMISSQYGRDFTSSHYDQIKPVYSIWIFPHPSKKFKNSLTEFYIDQRNLGGQKIPDLLERDLMRIIFIGLGDPEKAEHESIWRMLSVLLSNEMNVDKKRNILESEYGLKMSQELEREVKEVSNLGQGVFDQGLARGLVQGRMEGRTEGQIEERVETISKVMKKLNFTLDQALQFLDIPEEQYDLYSGLLKDKVKKS